MYRSSLCRVALGAAVAASAACGPLDDGPDFVDPDLPAEDRDEGAGRGTGSVTVAGSSPCSASFDAPDAGADVLGIANFSGEDSLAFNASDDSSTVEINSVFGVLDALDGPPEDTSYVLDASQVRFDALSVTCDGDSFLLINEQGESAADLPELSAFQVEVSDFDKTSSTTVSAGACRSDTATACRLSEGRADLRLDATWQTGTGDEVTVSVDVQDVQASWYEQT